MNSLVAVTGADGFVGSHLVETLVDRGHRVRAMVRYDPCESWGWLDALASDVLERVEVVPGDVRDPASVRDVLRDAEAAYHLAALTEPSYSRLAPRSYAETNVLGTLNVLEAVRDLRTPRLVHASTGEVYGAARRVPIDEAHPLQARSPFAATKIAADKLVESYHVSFGVPAVTLRPFGVFGPRQSARAFIPTVISQIAADTGAVQIGAPEPAVDLTFVRDVAEAFATAGSAPPGDVVGRAYNCGTGQVISRGRLARVIAELMGADPEVRCDAAPGRPRAAESVRFVCDSGLLRRDTGWRPQHTLEEGLKDTIEWFLDPANLARYRPSTYTI
jgi:nucleoside-diphosphate-sugar epimerase